MADAIINKNLASDVKSLNSDLSNVEDVINNIEGDYVLETIGQYVAVSADGVKTYNQLHQELLESFLSMCHGLPDGISVRPTKLQNDNLGTYGPTGGTMALFVNNTIGNAAGMNFMLGTDTTLTTVQLHTTSNYNNFYQIVMSTNNTITNRGSQVPTAKTNLLLLFYDKYKKI